eukprot:CAMPEP_0184481676 /NCGR_PEP_ID=MMETSP0113_2-20130426/3235_1 /TAXON_ID=91329 /ORGANISM="Norrisiella sphaerica, Strain BC52" /LENGTH=550 /DNA_ID=CAMNT_0026860943 /DNA_START=153 /DNA_END=1805 /DNA_ORIENTATION=-
MEQKENGVKSEHKPTSNGATSSSKLNHEREETQVVTEKGYVVKKADLIRIMIQSMKELGCSRSAELLEEESGVKLEQDCVRNFRLSLQNGDWKTVRELLPTMRLSQGKLEKAMYLILEEEFLELVEQGSITEALKILRNDIVPVLADKRKLNHMSSYLMYSDPEDLRKAADWPGAKGGSRLKLLSKLEKLMDPFFVIPKFRMLSLLDQSLAHQISRCQFHNSKMKHLSILHDHSCSLDEIPQTCIEVKEYHKNEVWFVRFSHDGNKLASASKDKTIGIWDVVNCRLQLSRSLEAHQNPPSFIEWNPNNQLLLSSDCTSVCKVWDVKSGKCKISVPKKVEVSPNAPESIMTCAWTPDGKKILTGMLLEKKVETWNLKGEKIHTWNLQHMIRDLKISEHGIMMVVGTNNVLKSYDLKTKERKHATISESSKVTSFCLSKDGHYALTSLSEPATIKLWDLRTNEVVRHYNGIKQSRYIVQASFGGAEEMLVISGSEDSQVYIWHRTSGDLLAVLPGHSGTVNSISWSPTDPCLFVSASDDSTIRVWGRNTSDP